MSCQGPRALAAPACSCQLMCSAPPAPAAASSYQRIPNTQPLRTRRWLAGSGRATGNAPPHRWRTEATDDRAGCEIEAAPPAIAWCATNRALPTCWAHAPAPVAPQLRLMRCLAVLRASSSCPRCRCNSALPTSPAALWGVPSMPSQRAPSPGRALVGALAVLGCVSQASYCEDDFTGRASVRASAKQRRPAE